MATFSTYEALNTLCISIPEWNERLDELNGQIDLRQIELARLTEAERPPTRSLKNKGSTESLRPKDGGENPFSSQDNENQVDIQMNPFDTPNSNTGSHGPIISATAARTAAVTTPPPLKDVRPTGAILRQPSHPTQSKAVAARKRKTGSLASGESIAPKYRTRSMIIVYYDSAVQQAFEDLVKFVSGSRNAMRKGKMNAKMAEMKRAAELELEADDDDDDDDDGAELHDLVTNSGNIVAAQKSISVDKQGASVPAAGIAAADSDTANEPKYNAPRLRFVSTRQMGPSRGDPRPDNLLSVGMLRGYRRSGGGSPDIFDSVDKGLEWVQSQCEHAAHQFLRDGDCSTEIANIKRRLAEVKVAAEKEVEKLKADGADKPPPAEETRSMQMKSTTKRREFGAPKELEVDNNMEVDDEAVDDLEPPKLIFKRSRDVGP